MNQEDMDKIKAVIENNQVQIVGPDGSVELPPSVIEALRQAISHMANGSNVFVIPANPGEGRRNT